MESKSIKVSKRVYDQLRELQAPRETYSEVVERLVSTVEPIREVSRILWPELAAPRFGAGEPQSETAAH